MPWTLEDVNKYSNKTSSVSTENSVGWTLDDVNNYGKPKQKEEKKETPIDYTPAIKNKLDEIFKPKADAKSSDKKESKLDSIKKSVSNFFDNYQKTPTDQNTYNQVSDVGGYKFGSNTWPVHKDDNIAEKTVKSVGNFVVGLPGAALNFLSAPGEGVRQASIRANDAIQGNEQKPFQRTSFTQDILPKGAGEKVEELKKSKPLLGGLAEMGIETVADPLTWVGGGSKSSIAEKADRAALERNVAKSKFDNNLTQSASAEVPTLPKPIEQKIKGELPLRPLPSAKTAQESIRNNDAGYITSSISNAAEKESGMTPINLQHFGEGGTTELKVSQFRTNTLERAKALTEEIRQKLRPEFFDYVTETKKEWQDAALKNIQENKAQVMRDIYEAPALSGGVQAHEAAILTTELIDEAKKTGSVAKLSGWLQTVAEKTRESARALKGTDTAWEKESVESALMKGQRVVDKVEDSIKETNPKLIDTVNRESKDLFDKLKSDMFNNMSDNERKTLLEKYFSKKVKDMDLNQLIQAGNLDYETIRKLVKMKYNIPVLDNSDIKFIIDNMDAASKLQKGSYEQKVLLARVQESIANKIPSTFADKLKATQRISLLLNPKTVISRNAGSNLLMGGLETIKDIPGTLIDKAVSGIRKSERTTIVNPMLKEGLQGAKQGLKEWRMDIKNKVNTAADLGQADTNIKTKIFDEINGNQVSKNAAKFSNKTHGVVVRALQLGDRPFYKGAYESRIAQLKKIKGTDVVTKEMQEEASRFALDRTFQNDSELSKVFLKIEKLSSNPAYQTVVNLLLPFKKTPANILDKFIDYSPGGAIKATTHAIATKGKGTFNQKKFVDTLARSMTGTGIALTGYLLAQKGLVTGGAENDKDVENLEKQAGKSNYAFKFGDNYFTFDWAQPASSMLAVGADIYKATSQTKDYQNAISEGVKGGVNTFFNQSMLQNITRLMSGYNPAASIGSSLLNTSTQAAPTLGKQFAQLIDPYQRETYSPSTLGQAKNNIVAKIPFASKTLPKKYDTLGNPVKAYQGKNNVLNVMLNPGNLTSYKPTKVQEEILRIAESSSELEKSYFPKLVQKYVEYTDPKSKQKRRIMLSGEEYSQYQKDIGIKTNELFKKYMNSTTYKNANDKSKAKILGKIISKVDQEVKARIIKNKATVIK